MQVKDSIRQIAACKAEGICTRDKLVSEWLRRRIETNDAVRKSAVAKLRQNWELDCPVDCTHTGEL
jgi:dissimilatory sulfite reductase (desulfoviridin) alpha/beta subunit